MTPEEWALRLCYTDGSPDRSSVALIVRAAVTEEREACAAHLDVCAAAAKKHGTLVTPDGLRHVAAAIRNRR